LFDRLQILHKINSAADDFLPNQVRLLPEKFAFRTDWIFKAKTNSQKQQTGLTGSPSPGPQVAKTDSSQWTDAIHY